MSTLFVGLDLGSRNCQLVAMNAEGSVITARRFATGEATCSPPPRNSAATSMSTSRRASWPPGFAPFSRRGWRASSSATRGANAWVAKDPNKSERVDARKLADLLRLNLLHEVYYPEGQSRRDFKLLVQHYDDLTAEQVSLKQKIKSGSASRVQTRTGTVKQPLPFQLGRSIRRVRRLAGRAPVVG